MSDQRHLAGIADRECGRVRYRILAERVFNSGLVPGHIPVVRVECARQNLTVEINDRSDRHGGVEKTRRQAGHAIEYWSGRYTVHAHCAKCRQSRRIPQYNVDPILVDVEGS